MCGIFGVYLRNENDKIDENRLETSVRLLTHRGPNNQSSKTISDQVGLGHTRLSIIDLSADANQPFEYENLSLVYNGEILIT